jgi:mono/diheme cytochrome c family protein
LRPLPLALFFKEAAKGLFKRDYLPVSGMPANDDRAKDIIRMGRNKMDGFGNVLTDEQINDLLAYLHTL